MKTNVTKEEHTVNTMESLLKELQTRGTDEELRSGVLTFVTAILTWALQRDNVESRQMEGPADTQLYWLDGNPFEIHAPDSSEGLSKITQDAMISDLLALLTSAFGLKPLVNDAQCGCVKTAATRLARALKSVAGSENAHLRSEITALETLTNTYNTLADTKLKLQQQKDDFNADFEKRRKEVCKLQVQLAEQEKKQQELNTEASLLSEQIASLAESEMSLRLRYNTYKENERSYLERKRELEQCESRQEESLRELNQLLEHKTSIEAETADNQRRIRKTKEECEKLLSQNATLLDPATNQRIQEIWRSFPADLFDEETSTNLF
ncbi:MAG: hypothetical protein Q4G68_08460 [Planctomycetia bacterium]|nr:hypothetical protein [Planctomycetia bacterium]